MKLPNASFLPVASENKISFQRYSGLNPWPTPDSHSILNRLKWCNFRCKKFMTCISRQRAIWEKARIKCSLQAGSLIWHKQSCHGTKQKLLGINDPLWFSDAEACLCLIIVAGFGYINIIFTNQNVSFVDEHAVFRKQCYSMQALISHARPVPNLPKVT